MIEVRHSQQEDFLRQYINLYCALGIKEELWLTPREKDFFIACVILYNQGIDLSSSKGTKLLENKTYFKKENKGVYIYRNKLKNKGWLANTKEGLTIPRAFVFKNGIPSEFKFSIKLVHEHFEESRSAFQGAEGEWKTA